MALAEPREGPPWGEPEPPELKWVPQPASGKARSGNAASPDTGLRPLPPTALSRVWGSPAAVGELLGGAKPLWLAGSPCVPERELTPPGPSHEGWPFPELFGRDSDGKEFTLWNAAHAGFSSDGK